MRTINQVGTGIWGALNEGLDAAEGELIAFLNSDDWWAPNKLELQFETLRDNPELQFVIGMARFVQQPGELPESARDELFKRPHIGMMIENMLARREVFSRLGKFDESCKISGDIDWFSRAKNLKIPYSVVPEVTIFRRLHSANLSFSKSSAQDGIKELLDVMRRKIMQSKKPK